LHIVSPALSTHGEENADIILASKRMAVEMGVL
jgi:hypothetical protein